VTHYQGTAYISIKDANVGNYPHLDVFLGEIPGRGNYWARITAQPAATIISTQVLVPAGTARTFYVNPATGNYSLAQDFPGVVVIPNNCQTSALSGLADSPLLGDVTIELLSQSGRGFAATDLAATIKGGIGTASSSANSPLSKNSLITYRITTGASNDGSVRLALSVSMFCDSALIPEFSFSQ
jgi:hypothetical protein